MPNTRISRKALVSFLWTIFWVAIGGFLLTTYARVYADFWSSNSFVQERNKFTIPLNSVALRNGGKEASIAAGNTVFPVSP